MADTGERYRTIDSTRELAKRAQKLFAGASQGNPLQSLGVRKAVEANLAAAAPSGLQDLELDVAASDVMRDAAAALEKVRAGNASSVTDREFGALEAIVLLSGRPAMRYRNGLVQMPIGDENQKWVIFVSNARKKINEASARVGQVGFVAPDSRVVPIGTAWRLGTDLVVTNRHVVQKLAGDPTRPMAEWTLDPQKTAVVNFSVTDEAQSEKRFAIAELAYTSAVRRIDLAILRLDPNGEQLPEPLPLDWDAESIGRELDGGEFQGADIYVVGHPSHRYPSEQIVAVFQRPDGFKRCSPGTVTRLSESFQYAFEHDCSTLGGNSGSCVLTKEGHKVVGLHYGGRNLNEATSIAQANLAVALSLLGDDRSAEILRNGRVT